MHTSIYNMSKNYQKECLYCKEQITMSDETGKWLPYNKDGSAHDCRNMEVSPQVSPASPSAKMEYEAPLKQEPGPKKYTLEEVVKKLESIGVIINVDRLMKQ